MQGMWVRSLAGELRSHMSPAQYSLLEENKPANSPHSEERVWKDGLRMESGPGPISSGTKPEDSTTAWFCARISVNPKPKAVVHHYRSEHHPRFKVCRLFLLLLWWRAQLRWGNHLHLRGGRRAALQGTAFGVKATSDRRPLCFCCSSSCQKISDPWWFRVLRAKCVAGTGFHHPPFDPAHSWPDLPVLFWVQYLLHKSQ